MSTSSILGRPQVATTRTARARELRPYVDREYIVPVILKAVNILELLNRSPNGLKLDQIQQLTGIARTTVYRILRTYVAVGYLTTAESGYYRIGQKSEMTAGFLPTEPRADLDS